MKLFKKMTISVVAIMMLFAVSACGDDIDEKEYLDMEDEIITEEVVDDADLPIDGEAGDIGEAKVKAIVLAKVPGATEADIYELEREYDNGRIEYEGSIYYDGFEYEFDVDGTNGNILQWEIDR